MRFFVFSLMVSMRWPLRLGMSVSNLHVQSSGCSLFMHQFFCAPSRFFKQFSLQKNILIPTQQAVSRGAGVFSLHRALSLPHSPLTQSYVCAIAPKKIFLVLG